MESEELRSLVAEHTELARSTGREVLYQRQTVGVVEHALLHGSNKVVVLDGPRRVGKTVALKQLVTRPAIADLQPLYCDLTDIRLRGVGIQELTAALLQTAQANAPLLLLLDEVHYTGETWARELKFASDHQSLRIVVADSAISMTKARLREEMLGRAHLVPMYPLSFAEWRGLARAHRIPIAQGDDGASLQRECAEYLNLGGFPANALRRGQLRAVQADLRERVVTEAVREDIARLHAARDIDNLERVFVARLANSGAQLGASDHAKETGASEPTVRLWIRAMLDTGLLWSLEPYTKKSAGKYERSGNQAKTYAVDASLVAACSLPVFGPAGEVTSRQIETAVAQAIRRYCEGAGGICGVYQRKRGGGQKDGEVDFVVSVGDTTYAVEVTAKNDRQKLPELVRIARELNASFAAVVSTRAAAEQVIHDGMTVHLLPLHELLMKLDGATEWPW